MNILIAIKSKFLNFFHVLYWDHPAISLLSGLVWCSGIVGYKYEYIAYNLECWLRRISFEVPKRILILIGYVYEKRIAPC